MSPRRRTALVRRGRGVRSLLLLQGHWRPGMREASWGSSWYEEHMHVPRPQPIYFMVFPSFARDVFTLGWQSIQYLLRPAGRVPALNVALRRRCCKPACCTV